MSLPQSRRAASSRVASRAPSHAGGFAVVEDRVPRVAHPVGRDEQLETVLACVARARDQGVDAGDVSVAPTEIRDGVEIGAGRQQLLRAWALERDQSELESLIL